MFGGGGTQVRRDRPAGFAIPSVSPLAVAVAAIALASALAGMPLLDGAVPAAHAQQPDNGDCAPGSADCIFRFTDTPVVELPAAAPSDGTRLIALDPVRNRLYVAYENTVAVYDANRTGYPLLLNVTFPGTPGYPLDAMAVNTRTGDLYVADYVDTDGPTYLHVMNASGSLSSVAMTAENWQGGGAVHPIPDKLHVDSERGLVYISTDHAFQSSVNTGEAGQGILVVDVNAATPNYLRTSGWEHRLRAYFVSSMAVNSTGQDDIVYAMASYYESSIPNWRVALNTLRFDGSGASINPRYTVVDRIVFATGHGNFRYNTGTAAHDMALDDRNDKLFILFRNGTLSWYDLTSRASGAVALPTFGGHLVNTAGSYRDLVLDEGGGLLYWFTSESVGVYRTSDGERLAIVDRPGEDGDDTAFDFTKRARNRDNPFFNWLASTNPHNAAIDAVPASAALPAGADAGDIGTGIIYALGPAGSNLTVIDPRPESTPERLAREAADGGTVAIPDGTYRDVYLSTDAGGSHKAMTIRSESGQPGGVVFTGASHVRVRNGDVAVQGIVFRDTTCHDKLEGADRPDGYLPEHVVNVDVNATHAGNITISNNVFENTCHGGILSGGLDGAGSGSASDVLISNNTFRDIGYNARHYDGVPDRLRHAIETGAYNGSVQMRDAEISSNAFEMIAGIAVDVRQARNLNVSGNTFADVPLSAVRVHGGSDGIAVRGNTIANASYAPNYDFLRGVNGSANLTQDAAILVIPDDGGRLGRTDNVNATGNTVSKSGGAFSVCGAVCEGNRTAGYATTTGSDADSVLGPADQDIRFNWNTLHMDNGDRLVENGVRGALDARYNYYPGYEPAAGLFRAGAQASGNLPAGTVLREPSLMVAPGDRASVLRVASANASDNYGAGDQIDIVVEFTKPVAVAGTPVLTIDAGPVDRNLDMTRHDGSILTFRYAVVDGDSSPALEYANRSSLAIGTGGGIRDLYTGATANLTLPPTGSPESLSSQGLVIGTPDTTAPTVLNVTSELADGAYRADRLVEVQVVFSENVFVGTGGGTPTILLDTGGAGSRAEYARGSGTETLVFEYRPASGDASGDLDYVGTDSLQRNGGTIADRVRNPADPALPEPGGPGSLAHSKDIAIDTEAPRVVSVSSPSADATYGIGSRINVTVSFSEAVYVAGSPRIELATGGAEEVAAYDSGSGSSALVFEYTVLPGDETGDLDYAGRGALSLNGGTIRDAAGHDADLELPEPGGPGSLAHSKDIAIDTAPGTALPSDATSVLRVSSGNAGGAYGAGSAIDITVAFSGAVNVTGTPTLALSTVPARSAAYVAGSDGDARLAFFYEVRAGDVAPALDYAGRDALSLNGGTIRDAAGRDANLKLPPTGSPDSLHASGIAIAGGTPGGGTPGGGTPGGGNATATVAIGPDGVPAGQGDLAGREDVVRVTIDVSGLPGAGTVGGTVQFPQGGVTVAASFGSVSFPSGVNATSVPADGLLVLHVVPADGSLPSNSTVQRGLAYDGSGTVVLQRVVEVGDEDARIAFDMPVRISLDGQAGGRAFYIAGASGQIEPIDAACGADDADRVHRHLNGTGECRIDSGGDMVVYTYHLTRFGTVLSENGAAPPVHYTCSIDLGMPNLAIDNARLGEYSSPAPQTILNTGSAPFESVGIEATRWQAGTGGTQPDAGIPSLPSPVTGAGNGTASSALVARIDASLPASLTEVGEESASGAYASVGGGTAVASGLGGGDLKDIWFKLNLTPYDAVQGETITQSVTYSAQCTGP